MILCTCFPFAAWKVFSGCAEVGVQQEDGTLLWTESQPSHTGGGTYPQDQRSLLMATHQLSAPTSIPNYIPKAMIKWVQLRPHSLPMHLAPILSRVQQEPAKTQEAPARLFGQPAVKKHATNASTFTIPTSCYKKRANYSGFLFGTLCPQHPSNYWLPLLGTHCTAASSANGQRWLKDNHLTLMVSNAA